MVMGVGVVVVLETYHTPPPPPHCPSMAQLADNNGQVGDPMRRHGHADALQFALGVCRLTCVRRRRQESNH